MALTTTWFVPTFLLIVVTSMAFAQQDHGVQASVELGNYRDVASFVDRRDLSVVRQSRDFSCGAAALATLLTYQWRDAVSENDVLTMLGRIIDGNELDARGRSGLTLLDLQRVAQARGYRAQGFRIASNQLQKLTVPVIVFIDPDGYKHFAVLKGIAGGRAYLADPSHGNISYSLPRFLSMWSRDSDTGIIFAAEPLFADAARFDVDQLAVPGTAHSRRLALDDVRSRLPFASLDSPGASSP